MSCGQAMTQVIPKGWDYKEIPAKCGQTGYHGDQLICIACRVKGIEPKEHDFYEAGEYFSEDDY